MENGQSQQSNGTRINGSQGCKTPSCLGKIQSQHVLGATQPIWSGLDQSKPDPNTARALAAHTQCLSACVARARVLCGKSTRPKASRAVPPVGHRTRAIEQAAQAYILGWPRESLGQSRPWFVLASLISTVCCQIDWSGCALGHKLCWQSQMLDHMPWHMCTHENVHVSTIFMQVPRDVQSGYESWVQGPKPNLIAPNSNILALIRSGVHTHQWSTTFSFSFSHRTKNILSQI